MCGSEDRHCPGGVRGRAEACAEAGAETGEAVLCRYHHWPGGGRAMLKPVLKPVFPNAYRPQAGFMNHAACRIPKTY